MIRLDARRLNDEVARCFNIAKTKKALSSKMNWRFRPIAGSPQHLPSPAGPRHFHDEACSARGSGNLVLAQVNASHLMSR